MNRRPIAYELQKAGAKKAGKRLKFQAFYTTARRLQPVSPIAVFQPFCGCPAEFPGNFRVRTSEADPMLPLVLN